jgi:DNA-binding winged helix-turn-helix (wHTH) protein/tetratricopeptide (TPR) repeat protein/TolB-like protein
MSAAGASTSHPRVPKGPPPGRLSFGPFVLDPETGTVLEDGRIHPLAPKPFETLLYLASRPGRVVSKTELMENLWPSTFVTDDVLVQCVVEIRRVLGDPAKNPRYIRTIPRKGYQFVAAVTPVTDLPASPPPAVRPDATRPSAGTAAERARTRTWRDALLAQPLRLVAALLALAGVVVVLLAWRAQRELTPPVAAAEPGTLVILPIAVEEPAPQNQWLRQGLAEMMRAQLGQTPGVHVLARHRVASVLAEAGHDEGRGLSSAAATVVARKLRAERLITGAFVRVEDRFVLNAQVVDVASGRIEGTASVRGTHPSGLLDAVDELTLKLLLHVQPASGVTGSWRPARLTTRSVEASREYTDALARFARGGRQGAEEAEAHLDEALRLDPTFAQAHVKKAEIQYWRQRWGYGNPDPAPAVRAATRMVKDLPDRERLLVESFEALIIQRQPGVALRHWNALLQFYPTYGQEVGVPGLAAETFLNQGRWDDIIMIGEAHVDSPSLPDSERARLCTLLAQAFRQKGEMERALRHAQRAVRVWPLREGPGFLNQRTSLGRTALEAGRRQEALAEFRAVAGSPEADATNLTNAAWGFYMAGAVAEAAAGVERALALDPTYGNGYHLRGWLRLARGEHAGAASDLAAAFERTPRRFGSVHQGLVGGDLAAHYYEGVAFHLQGNQPRAESTFRNLLAHAKRMQEEGLEDEAAEWQVANYRARAAARLGLSWEDPPRLKGDDTTYFVQSARLHAVQGRGDQALRELAQGIGLGHGEYRHLQDDPDFITLRDHPEFKRLVTDRLPR